MFEIQPKNLPHQQTFSLRYEAYIDNGSIDENCDETFEDEYDYRSNCDSFLEYIDGRPAGSIRACVYDPSKPNLTVPAMAEYGDEIQACIGSDTIFVEANKFVINPRFQHRANRLKFKLLKRVFDAAMGVNAEFLIGAPRPSQVNLYKHLFFKPISGVKSYTGVKFDTILLACPLTNARREVRENTRYHNLRRRGFT